MNAAERYNEMVKARQDQQVRLATPLGEWYWERFAHTYRFDPYREPEPQLAETLKHIEPGDDIIEIGGGAGRIGLPLALRAHAHYATSNPRRRCESSSLSPSTNATLRTPKRSHQLGQLPTNSLRMWF